MIRNCKICGKPFEVDNVLKTNAQMCSNACRIVNRRRLDHAEYIRNRKARLARAHEYYLSNKEWLKAYFKGYYQENKELIKQQARISYALKKGQI